MLICLLLCSFKMQNDMSLLILPTSSTAMPQELQTANLLWSDFKSCTLVFFQTSEAYYAILVLMYEGSWYQRMCIKHNWYQKAKVNLTLSCLKSSLLLTVNQPQLPEMLRKLLITLTKNSSHCCHLLNSYGYWSYDVNNTFIFCFNNQILCFVDTPK